MELKRRDWVLTQESFDRLLAYLDADRDRAGEMYEKIRLKLTKFFRWHGCALPDEYVDRTINRVARRIHEGASLHVSNPYLYFHGVALNVLREYWRTPGREHRPLESLPPAQAPAEHPGTRAMEAAQQATTEQRLVCLKRCLGSQAAENRRLLTEYLRDAPIRTIEHRKRMADALEIPLSALRVRVFRIRSVVRDCVRRCEMKPERPH
jgi:DNA-directed RNA polymerase specialized sigma24 family protein